MHCTLQLWEKLQWALHWKISAGEMPPAGPWSAPGSQPQQLRYSESQLTHWEAGVQPASLVSRLCYLPAPDATQPAALSRSVHHLPAAALQICPESLSPATCFWFLLLASPFEFGPSLSALSLCPYLLCWLPGGLILAPVSSLTLIFGMLPFHLLVDLCSHPSRVFSLDLWLLWPLGLPVSIIKLVLTPVASAGTSTGPDKSMSTALVLSLSM